RNATLAVVLAESILQDVYGQSDSQIVNAVVGGLENTRRLSGLRGRLDVIGKHPMIIADVSHNTPGIEAALRFARERCDGKLHVAIGLLRDKQFEEIAKLVSTYADVAHVTPLSGERAVEPKQLEDALSDRGLEIGPGGAIARIVASFLSRSRPSDALLLCGSHQVVGQLDPKLLV
ncbi:MAG: hypothetical protein HKN13_01120, partial [Rhodothermales bacterium]|nr:hypothetical protein [Rhodothermales bacterium]